MSRDGPAPGNCADNGIVVAAIMHTAEANKIVQRDIEEKLMLGVLVIVTTRWSLM